MPKPAPSAYGERPLDDLSIPPSVRCNVQINGVPSELHFIEQGLTNIQRLLEELIKEVRAK